LSPQILRGILSVLVNEDLTLPSLDTIFCSGDELSFALAESCRGTLPSVKLINVYGSSETTADATACDVSPSRGGFIPLGTPLPGVTVRILDLSGDEPSLVPPGSAGTIAIAGATLAKGYVENTNAALSTAAFAEATFEDGCRHRVFLSGDLGRIDFDGNLRFLGRHSDFVVVNGIRVNLIDIKRKLDTLDGVEEARVVSFASPNGTHLAAFLRMAAPHINESLLELETRIRRQIHRLIGQRIPLVSIKFVAKFPELATGKVDMSALSALAAQSHSLTNAAEFDHIEAQIAKIWMTVLTGVAIESDSNFFALGGDSFLGSEVVRQLNNQFDLSITFADLWDAPDFGVFCKMIKRNMPIPDDAAETDEGVMPKVGRD